ncbi:MAG: signal peptidase I [Rhizomicrobium sp.]
MPERGDVVVFRLPRDPSQTYIKRVIGLPGDRVQMIEGRLWINGKELALRADGQGKVESEDGTIAEVPRYIETLPNGKTHPIYKWTWSGYLDNTQEFLVPAGHMFMMGDNRNNSLDSRETAVNGGVGFVPVENLVGRAEFVVGSYDFLNARNVWSWLGEFRLSRVFNGVN